MYYFAYGSNMSMRRLQNRCSSAKPIGVFSLSGYRLLFNMKSLDGSGKGNIEPISPAQQSTVGVVGVVFDIHPSQINHLDSCESLGVGYDKQWLNVCDERGKQLSAFSYVALRVQSNLKPYDWYLQHLIEGAVESKMPPQYINYLQSFDCVCDPSLERKQQELSIYSS